MKQFLTSGSDPVVPGWRWPADQRSAGVVGVYTPCAVWGGIDPWDHRFPPQVVGVLDLWKDF